MTSINRTGSFDNFSTQDVSTRPAAQDVRDNVKNVKNTADSDNADLKKADTKSDTEAVEQESRAAEEKKNAEIRAAVDKINKSIPNTEVVFGIHDKTNRVMIKIIDKDSKKVIREYPPEKTLDIIAKVWEMAGILVDEKR